MIHYSDEKTDVSTLTNAIYAENATSPKGLAETTITLPIKMKNAVSITSYQFTLVLPDGFELAKDPEDDDYYLAEVSTDRTTTRRHDSFRCSRQSDGSYLVTCASSSNAVFSGNDGNVAVLTILASEGVEPGDYHLHIRDAVMTESGTNASIYPPNVNFSLTLEDYLIGDANGDGVVNISDYSMVISYLHGTVVGTCNVKAMDVNGDGIVNISDASAVISKLHDN